MKVSILVSIMFVGACIPFASHAACDSQCQVKASTVGERAAHKLMFPEFAQEGKLGRLIRAEIGLDICGAKGKSEAVKKLRNARLDEILEQRLKGQPIGSDTDSKEEQSIQFASFLSTVQALQVGYALGYQESAASAADENKSTKAAMCRAYGMLGDKVLFGDG